jgi:hypothetical protein
MPYRSTKDVAKMFKMPPGRLARAVWDGRVKAPSKGPSGVYLWSDRDIEHASWVLRRRDAGDVLRSTEVPA